jgi:3-dehydroquinate synthase
MTDYNLRHGEAVAKGIALDITYTQLSGLINESTFERILKVMGEIGFDLSIPLKTDNEMNDLMQGIQEFQEHLGGELCITLISGLGKKHDVNEIDMDRMKRAVAILNEHCKLYTV